MADNELLDAMRMTLSAVHMDRPVETITRRGTDLRRARVLSGVVSVGLVTIAGAALAVPLLTGSGGATRGTQPAGGSSIGTPATSGSTGTPRVKPAAWSVEVLPDETVRLTLYRSDFQDKDALEAKLAEVNVPAIVEYAPGCDSDHGPVDWNRDMSTFGVSVTSATDSSAVYVIDPSAIPSGDHLLFFTGGPVAVNPGGPPVWDSVALALPGYTTGC